MKRPVRTGLGAEVQVSVLNREPMGMKRTHPPTHRVRIGVSVLNREPMGMKRAG